MKYKKSIHYLFVLWGVVYASCGVADVGKDISQLHVRGEAQINVAADQASVILGVMTQNKDAKKAMADNSKKMQLIIKALGKLGLDKKNYKTQNFNIQPIWTSRPRSAAKDWQSSISSYRVSHQLHVSSKKIHQIGDIVSSATAVGANNIHSIHFSLANPRQYRSEAIAQAMANAKKDAQVLAAASGDSIVRTLSLRLDNTEASVISAAKSRVMSRSVLADSAVQPPPINGGDITVKASVSVVYEIAK